ncbi:MAG TPA: HepT-like ribonuclease domain-containing protein [Candidatus Kapabacteria bacterium]|nr:HepT-like ribonuclease domain-containing protein [Candidatus Kapabacteria bacterium]
MQSDKERLLDILESCEAISQFMRTIGSYSALLKSRRDQSALLYELAKIGEASAHVSNKVQAANPHIPWAGIKNLRNSIIHRYTGVDLEIVWEVLSVRVPQLREDIQKIVDGIEDTGE